MLSSLLLLSEELKAILAVHIVGLFEMVKSVELSSTSVAVAFTEAMLPTVGTTSSLVLSHSMSSLMVSSMVDWLVKDVKHTNDTTKD